MRHPRFAGAQGYSAPAVLALQQRGRASGAGFGGRAVSDPGARGRALDYLAGHNVMTLATHGPEGPWAAAVFYVSDGFDLYFISSPGSRHSRNVAAQAAAAATVQEDYRD